LESKEPYVKPVLEELGAVHDVTGGLFDIGSIIDRFSGRGGKPGGPPRPGSH
jgi:hypothetical protein